MTKKKYELWQGGKKFITGNKKELADFTGLSLGTIDNYCRPGYLESRANENDIHVVDVTKSESKSESLIQSEIILEINKRGHHLWRSNAGRIQDANTGAWIKLMPKGFSDTVGHRRSDGKAIYLEIKNAKGKLSADQIRFRDAMLRKPVIYGVARTVEEAIEIIEEGGKYHE